MEQSELGILILWELLESSNDTIHNCGWNLESISIKCRLDQRMKFLPSCPDCSEFLPPILILLVVLDIPGFDVIFATGGKLGYKAQKTSGCGTVSHRRLSMTLVSANVINEGVECS